MTRGRLILVDVLFVTSVALIWFATDGLKHNALMLEFSILFAFAACLKWHFEYYKLTKKIY
jgi:hypothetical protein